MCQRAISRKKPALRRSICSQLVCQKFLMFQTSADNSQTIVPLGLVSCCRGTSHWSNVPSLISARTSAATSSWGPLPKQIKSAPVSPFRPHPLQIGTQNMEQFENFSGTQKQLRKIEPVLWYPSHPIFYRLSRGSEPCTHERFKRSDCLSFCICLLQFLHGNRHIYGIFSCSLCIFCVYKHRNKHMFFSINVFTCRT